MASFNAHVGEFYTNEYVGEFFFSAITFAGQVLSVAIDAEKSIVCLESDDAGEPVDLRDIPVNVLEMITADLIEEVESKWDDFAEAASKAERDSLEDIPFYTKGGE